MDLFLCRWPNGDCSVVLANNKLHAIELLDEVGNAGGSKISVLDEFLVNFQLGDDGRLTLEGFGEDTHDAIRARCYPTFQTDTPTSEDVERERRRIKVREPEPTTELGKELKAQSDLATVLVDKVVSDHAKRTLRKLPVPKQKH